MRATVGLALMLSVIAACSGPQDEQGKAPMKVEDTAFGDMTQTMDRAKAVEQTTLQHKADVDKALESDGG
jgi:hypothetical protein